MIFFKRMLFLFFPIALLLSSCTAIGSIFKAGVWVGVMAIVIVVAIILWLVNKLNKK